MLVDTSTLLRTLQPLHPQRQVAQFAIKTLTSQGRELHIAPQNLVELWVVATRPVQQNGLGMVPSAAAGELARLKSMFVLLPETSAIFPICNGNGPLGALLHVGRFRLRGFRQDRY